MLRETDELTPKQVAALKKQLKAANERLLFVERERRQLKDHIAKLAARLPRDDDAPPTERTVPAEMGSRPRS